MESLSPDGFHVFYRIFLNTRNLSGTQLKYFVAKQLRITESSEFEKDL